MHFISKMNFIGLTFLFWFLIFGVYISYSYHVSKVARFISSELCAIRKIGVVGGGIAGLGVAACLKQSSYSFRNGNPDSFLDEIEIFESKSDILQSALGGGVQLSSGAKVLDRLGLLPELLEISQPLEGIVCRNTQNRELYRINLSDTIRASSWSNGLIAPATGRPYYCTIMRDALIQLLYNTTQSPPASSPFSEARGSTVRVHSNCKVEDIMESASEVKLLLKDGEGKKTSSQGFDLIIIADGVNTLLQNPNLGFRDMLGRSLHRQSIHTDFRISYFVLPASSSSEDSERQFLQFMGDGIYVLIGHYRGLQQERYTMLAIVYRESQERPVEEGREDWRSSTVGLEERVIRQRLQRGRLNTQPEIMNLIDRFYRHTQIPPSPDHSRYRSFDLGVKNRFIPLQSWSTATGRVIAIGDSIHAMAPFFGQGANQALLDAYCLATLILQSNRQEESRSRSSPLEIGNAFEKQRKWLTATLVWKSYFLGYLETLGGEVGTAMKEKLFQLLFKLGITSKELLEAARFDDGL